MKNYSSLIFSLMVAVLPAAAAQPVASSDKTFAEKVAVDGLAEVKLGELAKEKGASAKVKDFGKHMVIDHSKANDDLKKVATKEGLTLPAKVDAEHEAVFDKLSKLSGAEFDKAYLTEMISAHKKAIEALETEAKDGQPPFKSWAVKTLPTIKQHLKMAEADKKS